MLKFYLLLSVTFMQGYMNNNRQSNIELLRLVCMFLIIMIHFTAGIFVFSETYPTRTGFEALFPKLLHGLSMCAVNTFILISGYFSIRPKAKSFFKFYIMVAFYAGLIYLIHLYLVGSHINRWNIFYTLFPFGLYETSTNWWFPVHYIILYIISPILNKIIDSASKREMQLYLLLMAVIVFYFGFYRNLRFADMGFNFINFIFLYFIGRYIFLFGRCKSLTNNRLRGGGYAAVYFAIGLIIGISEFISDRYLFSYNPLVYSLWQYNSPLCILGAICLFLTFLQLQINSKTINFFASSAFPIYLLHNNNYIAQWQYDIITPIYDSKNQFVAYSVIIGLAIGLCVVIPLIDKLRLLITDPIVELCCKIYYKIKEKIMFALNK